MSQLLVKKILESALSDGVKSSINWPIAWPNAEFVPPSDGHYLECHILPAARPIVDIQGKLQQFAGVMQISVVVRPGEGSQEAVGIAEMIAQIFNPDEPLIDFASPGFVVSVTSWPTIYDGTDSPQGYMIPVSFEYEAH